MKFFKFYLTLIGVILHMMTILINLRCCHANLLLWMCRGIEKWSNWHIWHNIGLILLKFGLRGYFWILNPKSIKKILYDVILTSKWREGKIAIYRLQKMHMTSLWRHLLFNFSSSYKGLSAHQIRFNFGQGKQSYGGGQNPPPPPQVENVLNCPGEIGLILFHSSRKLPWVRVL